MDPIKDDDHVWLNDAHVCVTTILLGTRQPPDERWWGTRGVPYPRSSVLDPTDPSHGLCHRSPIPSHPPFVILAPGIKAIARSRIPASCKKSANQVDPGVPVLAFFTSLHWLPEETVFRRKDSFQAIVSA